MKHLKTWLIEKEWDVPGDIPIGGNPASLDVVKGISREKKIAFGYTNLERARKDCEIMNKECLSCPRRTALHTTYKLLEHPIHVRMLTADETYRDKAKATG